MKFLKRLFSPKLSKEEQELIYKFKKNFSEILFEKGVYDSFDHTITPTNIKIINSNGAEGITCELKFPNGISISDLDKCLNCFRQTLIGKCMIIVEELPRKVRFTAVTSWFTIDTKEEKTKSPLHIFIGYDLSLNPIVLDFAKFPHMLITGSTGSGKTLYTIF